MGTINGFLFFVNVVKIYEPVFLDTNGRNVVLEYALSWANLDLGIYTCFFHGLNTCQKVGLQFAFPLYLLLLVLLIVAACRCGQWVGFRSLPWVVKFSDTTTLLMGSKIVPVLATLLLLSYTKVITAIILIYQKADIEVYDSNGNVSDFQINSVWYANGSVGYLTQCHAVMFGLTTAIVVPLVFVFTAFLMLFPLMERHLPRLSYWRLWHIRLKPWYDAYGGPYKDEYRFWTGLLLLVRCALVLTVIVQSDISIALSVLMWQCLILIPLVALLQVYNSTILNVLETFYLSSLLAMVFLSIAKYSEQLEIVIIAFLCLSAIMLVFHSYQQAKSSSFAVLICKTVADMRKNLRVSKQHSQIKEEEKTDTNVTFTIVGITSLDKVCEPLLTETDIS